MKLGLCTWSYNRSILKDKKITFEQMLEICAKELKIGGVDIITDLLPRSDKEYLLKIKKMCTDLHLNISSLSPGNNFGKPKKEERDAEVETVKKWLDAAYVLGAPVLRIFSGWPWPVQDKERLWPDMVRCIKESANCAKELGITLAIEPHNDGGFLPTAVDTLRLIKEINSPWVGINLDTGNYQDPDNYKGIRDTIKYAPHIHAKIHKLSPDGKELEFDYDKIFTIFKEANYRGFVSMEYEGKEDELQYVPIGIEMLKRYASKYSI